MAQPAYAAPDDEAAEALVEDVLGGEYSQAKYADAKRRLQGQLEKCRKPGRCSPQVKAQIYVALGMAASQIGMADEAKNHFANAFSEDASAVLPSFGTSPTIKAQFEDAKRNARGAASSDGPTPIPTPVEQPAGPVGGKMPGWDSVEAFEHARKGLEADLAGRLDECIEHDKKSLELEEKARTRLHLASCEFRSGKLLDALRDARAALKAGLEQRDAPLAKAARNRVEEIVPRIPKVTFVPPSGIENFRVTFDDREVKGDLTKKFSVDPGKHTVHAEGRANGNNLVFDEEIFVKEGETYTVNITLKQAQTSEYLTPGQLTCMQAAKSQEEVVKCLPANAKNMVVRAGMDLAAYTDTTAVHVFTPEIRGSVTSPTSGWNVGGSFVVDFVSAASPDLVSTASRAFIERRYAGTLGGGYKPGLYGAQANAAVSSEPDYLSITGGGALTADLNDKLITPRVAFSHTDDTIGRNDTPFDQVHLYELGKKRKFYTNTFELGSTFVMSPTSVLVLGGTLATERGDQSKIYRFVPMFSPRNAEQIAPGQAADVINRGTVRLPVRPIEQLPTGRDRFAVAARFLHRFPSATLRLEERIYYDTWGIKATTTDARYMHDLGRRLRVWPHFRLHGQTGANFYQLAYSAVITDTRIEIPTYRTGDRELSPMASVTLGGGARVALSSPEAETQFAITMSGDMMYSRYFNSLYITQRTALYGTLGIEVEF